MSLTDSERKAAWQYRRRPVCHVHKEKSPTHRPGYRGAHLPSQGERLRGRK